MKTFIRTSIAIAAGMMASTAMAQSQATLYGIIDTGVSVVTNSFNPTTGGVGTTPKMMTLTGSVPSRFGVRGSEDLGNGLSAIYTLESGFSPDTGASGQGGRLFGRQAFVGLKGDWGQVTLGRLTNMTALSMMKSDVMGPNVFALGSIDTYLPNARSDNAIGYLGSFSGLTVGATYSLGRDSAGTAGSRNPSAVFCGGETAGDATACRQVTALLAYDASSFGVSAAYDTMKGGTGAGDLPNSNLKDRRAILSGYVMLGQTKLGAGIIDRKKDIVSANAEKSQLYFLGVSHPFSSTLSFDAQVAQHKVKDTDKKSLLTTARLTYSLSKRTALYSTVGHITNSGNAAVAVDAGGFVQPGKNQTGFAAGIRHAF